MPTTTRVYATDDRLSVRLDCMVESGSENDVIAEVLAQSKSMGVEPELREEDIRAAINRATEMGPRISGLTLLTGTPPVAPVPGSLSWQRDFFSAPLVENPKTGKVDYRQHLDSSIVVAGDVLATLIPPQPGTPGLDVFGKPIAVAKPAGPRVRAGNGVLFDEAAGTYTATLPGRVRFAKGVIAVDQTYAIAGSIGLKTGHVSHPGSVDVARDIEPDSILEAGGTVHVSGAVEESDVTAGGDILVGHGIIGGGKATLHAGGCIEAAFAERAVLNAGYDIRIRREMIQCTVHAHGMLQIPDGQIIGGVVNAVFGIDAGQVGSHGDVSTTLIVGEDAALQEQIAARRGEAETCIAKIKELNERIAPLKTRDLGQSAFLREKLDTIQKELDKEMSHRDFIADELGHLLNESKQRAKAVIRIRKRVYPNTHLRIAHVEQIVDVEMSGPLVARLNDDGAFVLEPDQHT